VGYNARRASLAIIEAFTERMAVYELPVIDFSILSLITHNPGITSRQLSSALKIQPPNLVAKVSGFEARGLIERQPHPQDGRAVGLHLTPEGATLMAQAERTAIELEDAAAHRLSSAEKKTLIRLLQKVYR
jgi:DNA-binding MarR family transcriptional regulator